MMIYCTKKKKLKTISVLCGGLPVMLSRPLQQPYLIASDIQINLKKISGKNQIQLLQTLFVSCKCL